MGLTLTVLGCSGSYPGAGDACSGYLVRSPSTTVVVDLGSGTLANLQHHVAIAALDAVVLSHGHPDHWLDLPLLRNAMRYLLDLDGLPVHGTAETLDQAQVLISELTPTLLWSTIDEQSSIEVGDLSLRFGRTDHPVETLAVRVDGAGRSLLYSADTGSAWAPGALAEGIDLFLCEASLPNEAEDQVQHLSGRQAGALARSIGTERLVLTHVSPGVDREAQRCAAAGSFDGRVELASVGATFDV